MNEHNPNTFDVAHCESILRNALNLLDTEKPPVFVSETVLAKLTGVPPKTLRKARWKGDSTLPYIKNGTRVMYDWRLCMSNLTAGSAGKGA